MKTKKMMIVLLAGLLLAGCSETSNVTSLNEITNEQTQIGSGSTSQRADININGIDIPLETNYKIENQDGWKFTHTSSIGLSISLLQDIEGYEVKVGAVYADVSIVSKLAKYHGVRQDSLFIEYKELDNDGISLSQATPYVMPFMVEGINQNETFLNIYNGSGYSSSRRITENDIKSNGNLLGAKLNVVWTIYIKDKQTGATYMYPIVSNVGLPVAK